MITLEKYTSKKTTNKVIINPSKGMKIESLFVDGNSLFHQPNEGICFTGPYYGIRSEKTLPFVEHTWLQTHSYRDSSFFGFNGFFQDASWRVAQQTIDGVQAELSSQDLIAEKTLKELLGQNFKATLSISLKDDLLIKFSIVSDFDSVLGIQCVFNGQNPIDYKISAQLHEEKKQHPYFSKVEQFIGFPDHRFINGEFHQQNHPFNIVCYCANQENCLELGFIENKLHSFHFLGAQNPEKPLLTVSNIEMNLKL